MTHLSRKHLLDLIEDPDGRQLPPERRQHVHDCDACRQDADALTEVLSEIRHAPGAEPSPLFWDHLAARVSQAILHETPAPFADARSWGVGRQTAAWTAVALAVLLGSTMVAWRATLHAPTVRSAAGATVDAMRLEDVENDRAWDVVQAAADGLQWDDVQAAGIGAGPGSAEGVMMELTPEERDELAHLLETEIKRSGA